MSGQRIGTQRLASLSAAEAQDMAARRGVPEVVIEADHAKYLGPRQVQRLGDHRDGIGMDVAKRRLKRVKDR
jgi:hypothetical protein